jgi:hypothetical protein
VLKVLELGASIIHGANQYMLSLAREVNLTLSTQDDTGAAFSIWDGRDFVFSQVNSVAGTDNKHGMQLDGALLFQVTACSLLELGSSLGCWWGSFL